MNLFAVLLLVITGVAGVYLFLTTGGEQRAAHQEARTQHRLAVEKFDEDFQSVMNGQGLATDPERAGRIQKLEVDLAEREAKRKAAEAAAAAAEADLRVGIEKLAGTTPKNQGVTK